MSFLIDHGFDKVNILNKWNWPWILNRANLLIQFQLFLLDWGVETLGDAFSTSAVGVVSLF